MKLGGVVFTASAQVEGECRPGSNLSLAEAARLGMLPAKLTTRLPGVLTATPPGLVESVAAIETPASGLPDTSRASRPGGDAMDAFVRDVLPRRRRLLSDAAEQQPRIGAACGPAGGRATSSATTSGG